MKAPALLIVDAQKGFYDPVWGRRNNPNAEENIRRLLENWRRFNFPVIHVRHFSKNPDSPLSRDSAGVEYMEGIAPVEGEKEMGKTVNSAFIGTDLEEYLRLKGLKELFVVGFTTDHCVSTTTRMAGNLGFEVGLIADATATFDRKSRNGRFFEAEIIHEIHLASLDNEFCRVIKTREALKSPES